MSSSRQALATCGKCGAAGRVDIFDSINVGADPSLKERVRSGELFTWTCPSCGKVNLLRYPTLYHDPSARLMIWLTDDEESLKDRVDLLFASPELSGYTGRFVKDAGSLIEKINIFDAGLDDVAMEICKYVTLQELSKDVPLKFFKMDGPDNEITLTYPQNGEMEMVNIGFNLYEDALGILNRNPQLRELASGFVRIDSDWLSQYFR